MRAGVVTVSSSLARDGGDDRSGDHLVDLCTAAGLEVSHELLPDDRAQIAAALRRLADEEDARFVFTTGGTGLTPDDVTPEATRSVIERDAPGFAEAMRAEGARHTPLGILTRGVSGVAAQTLIVNFPGSPKAIDQLFVVLAPTLGHVVQTLRGDSSHHGRH